MFFVVKMTWNKANSILFYSILFYSILFYSILGLLSRQAQYWSQSNDHSGMGPANERRCYYVTHSLVGWAHTQNDPCKVTGDFSVFLWLFTLTHWGRVTHICVSRLTITGSDNGLSPGRRQAIIWTNAGILLIGPLGTNFSENLIEILTFSCTKMQLKVSSAKWRPFCLGLNVLNTVLQIRWHYQHIESKTKWPPFCRQLFQMHFLNKNAWISINISLKFVPEGQINNIPALVQIMAWHQPGSNPLSEPTMLSLLMHIYTRPY